MPASVLGWKEHRGSRAVLLRDDPELTVKGVDCRRYEVDGKEAAPTLECHIVTVSILLAAVTPVTLEMAGQ